MCSREVYLLTIMIFFKMFLMLSFVKFVLEEEFYLSLSARTHLCDNDSRKQDGLVIMTLH